MIEKDWIEKERLIAHPGGGEAWLLNDKPFTGTAYELNDKGQILSKEEFKNGLRHGEEIFWFDNGQKESLGYSRWNIPHGHFWEWDEDGQLIMKGEVQYGTPIWRKQYDHSGKVVEDYSMQKDTDEYREFLIVKDHFESLWSHLGEDKLDL